MQTQNKWVHTLRLQRRISQRAAPQYLRPTDMTGTEVHRSWGWATHRPQQLLVMLACDTDGLDPSFVSPRHIFVYPTMGHWHAGSTFLIMAMIRPPPNSCRCPCWPCTPIFAVMLWIPQVVQVRETVKSLFHGERWSVKRDFSLSWVDLSPWQAAARWQRTVILFTLFFKASFSSSVIGWLFC